jgi:hypothetical protein
MKGPYGPFHFCAFLPLVTLDLVLNYYCRCCYLFVWLNFKVWPNTDWYNLGSIRINSAFRVPYLISYKSNKILQEADNETNSTLNK